MLHPRVIPCLLMRSGGLVKTVKFRNARYVGDPINAVRIFNEKEVDELVFLDIGSAGTRAAPDFDLLADIASAADQPRLVSEAAALAGSSGVVVSMDVRRSWLGSYTVCVAGGTRDLKREPAAYARDMEKLGAGEILLNAIDRDGTREGYDLELVRRVSEAVSIPVVVAGGAGDLRHFREATEAGASALAAGSMFVFHGKHDAVLITYPEYEELDRIFK
jgi:cyclase